MGKVTNDSSLDAALNFDINAVERLVVCSAEPSSYSNVSSVALADVAMTSSDLTLANGDSGGRKYTTTQKTGVAIDTSGTATHIALVDDTGTTLLTVTTCDSLFLTSGGQITIPAFSRTINDPT